MTNREPRRVDALIFANGGRRGYDYFQPPPERRPLGVMRLMASSAD